MKKIARSVTELIGGTPLVELCRIQDKYGLQAHILAKMESMNPAGSAKDRIAKRMIESAEKTGQLKPGSVIVEPTSGNTGIGLAAVAAARGYRVILTMPETMSVERRNLLAAYGAQIILTPGPEGMDGAVRKAEELVRELPNAFLPGQFVNPENPMAHYLTTGPEIWQDTAGDVDAFVAGVGSGGTVSGAGKYLKEQKSSLWVVAVEPQRSPLLSGGKAGPHGLQGLGANFIPKALNTSIYDEVMPVSDENAYALGRDLARCEGLLSGISSGAAVWAAIQLAKRAEYRGKNIVTVLPDTGERYLSTPMFQKK